MATRNKIAKHLARALGSPLIVNRDVVYSPGFGEIAHGIAIDGTPYKDTVFVLHFRLPFLYPLHWQALTYCDRIPSNRAGRDFFFVGDDKAIAETIVERISETGLREEIGKPIALDEIYVLNIEPEPERYHSLSLILEVAMAHHLTGRFERSAILLQFLRQFLARGDSAREGQWPALLKALDTVERVLPLFDGPPAEVTARLRALIFENATRLGFIAAPPTLD